MGDVHGERVATCVPGHDYCGLALIGGALMEEYIKALQAMIDILNSCTNSILEFGKDIEKLRESVEYRQAEIYEQWFSPAHSDN